MIQARENVQTLLDELRPFLEAAGIPSSQINVATGFDFKINHYVKAYDWLHAFSLCPQLVDFKKVWALRTPDQWKMYDILEVTGLREQDMLAAVKEPLMKRWRLKRPRMFGPSKPEVPDEETDETADSEDSE